MELNDFIPSNISIMPSQETAQAAKMAGQVASQTVTEASDPTKELSYITKRSTLMVAGKKAAEAAGESVASPIATFLAEMPMMSWASSASAIDGIAGLLTVGLAAGVSATVTQMDYIHRKDVITNMYKEELATRLHKPLKKITRDDLDTLAKENRVLGEEMAQISKQRTFGVGLSFLATMAALSVVKIALPALLPGMGEAIGAIGEFAVGAIAGLITYNIVKEPLHVLADKLFNLDYVTTHDHIEALSKKRAAGHVITREQVVSVFASAHHEIDSMVMREFGKKFDELSDAQKAEASAVIAQIIPLDDLVKDINSRKVNATELAFAVDGQISGIQHGRPTPEKEGFLGSIFTSVKKTFGFKNDAIDNHGTQQHINALAKTEQSKNIIPPQPEANRISHVQRLGRDRDNAIAHVERIDQQRADQTATTQLS